MSAFLIHLKVSLKVIKSLNSKGGRSHECCAVIRSTKSQIESESVFKLHTFIKYCRPKKQTSGNFPPLLSKYENTMVVPDGYCL